MNNYYYSATDKPNSSSWITVLNMWRLLVLTLLSAVFGTESADIDCDRLSAASNCSCNKRVDLKSTWFYYKLECPAGSKINITLSSLNYLSHDLFFGVECAASTNMSRLMAELSGFRVGDVHYLKLSGCSLSNVPIRDIMSSAGIDSVDTLEINNNINTPLQKKNFEDLANLRELRITNSNLMELPEDLFEDLHKLLVVEMKHNVIDLPELIFSFTPTLFFLTLNNNSFTRLKPGLFSKFNNLFDLKLMNNRLVNITNGVYSTVNGHIKEVGIEEDGYETLNLPAGFFSNGFLRTILMEGSSVTALDADVFRGCKNITYLKLNQNLITNLYENTFRDLRRLKHLDLSENRISRLPERLLSNATILEYLNLSANKITHLPKGLLKRNIALKYVDLSKNHITQLPEGFFRHITNLNILKVNNNRIQELPKYLYRLRYLYLGFNQIDKIGSFSLFGISQLKCLDISNNNISTAADDLDILRLEELRLANNSLTTLHGNWLNVKRLDLSFNNIRSIQINNTIIPKDYDVHINITNNNISRIDVQHFSGHQVVDNGYYRHFHLENNPLNCDCHLLPFIQLYRHTLPHQNTYLSFINIHYSNELRCIKPLRLSNTDISGIANSALTCDLSHSEDYMCPTNCSCEYRPIDQRNIITCQDAGLTQLPEQLTVNSAANHTELNVVDNHLEQLQLPFNNGYDNVTHWRLSGNDIEDIRLTEKVADKLELLDLSFNKLTRLSADTIQLITRATNLHTIVLHGNPWNCDCDAKLLRTLLSVKYTQVTDIKKVTCLDGRPIIDLCESDLCAPPFFKQTDSCPCV